MPGTMSRADLVADLQRMLHDSADSFAEQREAFDLNLDRAAARLSQYRPRKMTGSLTAVADQTTYTAPAGVQRVTYCGWGDKQRRERTPWDSNWPGDPHTLDVVDTDAGPQLRLDPAPTPAQIADLGSDVIFDYQCGHTIAASAASTTVRATDRVLLLMAAVIEALKDLAMRNVTKPVSLGPGGGSLPRNGTPAALVEEWDKAWIQLVAR